MHLRDFRLTTCFLAAVSQRQTEASNFGPQQAGDKFNRTRRIESGRYHVW